MDLEDITRGTLGCCGIVAVSGIFEKLVQLLESVYLDFMVELNQAKNYF